VDKEAEDEVVSHCYVSDSLQIPVSVCSGISSVVCTLPATVQEHFKIIQLARTRSNNEVINLSQGGNEHALATVQHSYFLLVVYFMTLSQ
jgi:hypothetical protein